MGHLSVGFGIATRLWLLNQSFWFLHRSLWFLLHGPISFCSFHSRHSLGFSASRLVWRFLGFSASRLVGFSASRLVWRSLGFSASRLVGGFSASRLVRWFLGFSASRLRVAFLGPLYPRIGIPVARPNCQSLTWIQQVLRAGVLST